MLDQFSELKNLSESRPEDAVTWIDPINRDAHFLKLVSEVILNLDVKKLSVFASQRSNMYLNPNVDWHPFFPKVDTINTGKISWKQRANLLYQYIPSFQAVANQINSKDLVIYSSGMSLPEIERLGIQKIKRKSPKVFVLIHNLEDTQATFSRFSQWRTLQLLQAFDGWIFLSDYVREKALARLNIPIEKTHVMLHPHFQPMLESIQLDPAVTSEIQAFAAGRSVIAYISRLDQDHGIDLFYQLLQASTRQGLPVCGVIIGRLSREWGQEKNEAEIHKCGLTDKDIHIRLGAYTYPELRSVLANTDFVFAPYRRISQSGAIALALGEKVPVIASHAGANAEMVKPNLNGLLFDIDDLDRVLQEMTVTYGKGQTMRQRFATMTPFNSHLDPSKNVLEMLTWLKTQV